MANTTYRRLLDHIEAFASAHLQIKKFGADFKPEMPNFATENEAYPILYVTPTSSIFNPNTTTFSIDVYCWDIIQKDRENINYILSDTNQILNDLVTWFRDGDIDGIDVIDTSIATPINNGLLDYAAGWQMTINFDADTFGLCEIPFDNSGGEKLPSYLYPSKAPRDIYVTGGTYNSTTGTATFKNNAGDSFDINGFSTGSGGVNITGPSNYITMYGPNNSGLTQSNIYQSPSTKFIGLGDFNSTNLPERQFVIKVDQTANPSVQTRFAIYNADTGDTQKDVFSFRSDTTGTSGSTFQEFGGIRYDYLNHNAITQEGIMSLFSKSGDTNNFPLMINHNGLRIGGTNAQPSISIMPSAASSGLRLARLSSTGSSISSTTALGVDSNGDVILIKNPDTYVTGGTYNSSTGISTFTNNTGGTFTISGYLTGDFVPYSGANKDVNLGEWGIQLGNLEFDNSPTNIPTTAGSMYWNDTNGTTELIMKGGNVKLPIGEEIVARVVNKTVGNTPLTQSGYQIVKVVGATGQRLSVALAQANNDLNSADTIGVVTEDIAINQEGFITVLGQVSQINTTGSLQGETWADGDVLYLSPTTAGKMTNIKPNGFTGHIVIVGYVEYAHSQNGKIFVKIQNGYELEELHDVAITAYTSNGILYRDTTANLWKTASISSVLGYTPLSADTNTFVTGGTFSQASGDITVTNNTGGTFTISSILPSQTGNANRILQTSGSGTTWFNIFGTNNTWTTGQTFSASVSGTPFYALTIQNNTVGTTFDTTGSGILFKHNTVSGYTIATNSSSTGTQDRSIYNYSTNAFVWQSAAKNANSTANYIWLQEGTQESLALKRTAATNPRNLLELYTSSSSSAEVRLNLTTASNIASISGQAGRLGLNHISPTSNVHMSGSVGTTYVSKSTNYTAGTLDYGIICSGAIGFAITLPTSVGIAGREYFIKNIGTTTITLATTSSQTIDGSIPSTYNLTTQWSKICVFSDGANWFIKHQ